MSTSAPEPDSPVEYDSIATRGSIPNCVAVAADEIAMSASCSAVGIGHDRAVAVDEHPVGERHEEHTRHHVDVRLGLDDLERGADGMRGRVHAPDTMPSASPRATIIVPKYDDVLHGVARLLERDALVGAPPLVLVGEAVHEHVIVIGEHRRSGDVEAEPDGARADLDLLAEDREVGDIAREQRGRGAQDAVVVSLGQHDVLARRAAPARAGRTRT